MLTAIDSVRVSHAEQVELEPIELSIILTCMEAMEYFSTNTFSFRSSAVCCMMTEMMVMMRMMRMMIEMGRGKESDGVGLRPLAVGDQTSRIVAVSRYSTLYSKVVILVCWGQFWAPSWRPAQALICFFFCLLPIFPYDHCCSFRRCDCCCCSPCPCTDPCSLLPSPKSSTLLTRYFFLQDILPTTCYANLGWVMLC